MRFLLDIVRAIFVLGMLGVSALALGGAFGFLHPLLDVLNHFQSVWLIMLLIGCVLSFVFFWSRTSRNTALLVGLVGLAGSLSIVGPEYFRNWNQQFSPTGQQPILRLMSHNLFGRNYNMLAVAASITAENPDIIAFQEYFDEQRTGLHSLLVDQYPHSSICSGGRRSAIAIYAKQPFEVLSGSICPDNLAADSNEVARIVAGFGNETDGTFSIITTHLNWPIQISALRRADPDFNSRLAAMTSRKTRELSELGAILSAADAPLLVVGDFNSTPWSYELRNFVADTGTVRHSFSMLTYPARFYLGSWKDTWPFLPLDHLLTRNEVQVHAVRTGAPVGSDHLPIITDFSVVPQAASSP